MSGYEFTTDWFTPRADIWRDLLAEYQPTKVLEIGSWEGRSACFIIEQCAQHNSIELHCVDTWQGGIEHDPAQSNSTETRFDAFVNIFQRKLLALEKPLYQIYLRKVGD